MKLKKEDFIPVEGGNVYYVISGDGPKTPLLVLHGGPGFDHRLLRKMDALGNERPIIYYDQLGAGKSDRPKDKSLWNIERFVCELGQIKEHLALKEVVLYGGSWGTMLGVDYLLTQPSGVRAAILAHPCLSASRWKADTSRLLKELPISVQEAISKHESAGTTESEEYQSAFMEFVKKFVCRIDPLPQEVLGAFGDANMEVYTTMWGPSEWYPVGNLKDYERINYLKRIKVPTLFMCGQFDEATPATTGLYHKSLPGSKLSVIENASHLALWEQEETYISEIKKFLSDTGV